LLLADIDDLCVHLAAVTLELLSRGVGLVFPRAPNTDVGARLGQRIGHPEADATVAASHQCDFAREIEALVGHASLLPLFAPPSCGLAFWPPSAQKRSGQGGGGPSRRFCVSSISKNASLRELLPAGWTMLCRFRPAQSRNPRWP